MADNNISGNKADAPNATTSQAVGAANDTVTRRTLKLQSLAGIGTARPTPVTTAPAAKPAAEDDTRTRRTLKLSELAGANPGTPRPAAAPAVKPALKPPTALAEDTVTRRTQKLNAMDTQDVANLTGNTLDDTRTRKTVKLAAPSVLTAAPGNDTGTRKTVRVSGIAPVHAPEIDLDAKPGDDTRTRKTVKIEAPAETAAAAPAPDASDVKDTRTAKVAAVKVPEFQGGVKDTRTVKVAPVAVPEFKSGNVDDTVKLQRPAPKPVMPGSVTPAQQGTGAPAVGGIKLNIPKPAPAPAPKPAPAPAPAAPAAPATPEAPAAEAQPTGNLGKNQKPPKKRADLKVNTDALKDLGSAPMVKGDQPSQEAAKRAVAAASETGGAAIAFAVIGTLAALIMIFVAAVATTDYLNHWTENNKIQLPIISDQVIKY